MFDVDRSFVAIEQALTALHAGAIITEPIEVSPATVLLGPGSPLDSMAFVAFVSELEDRLMQASGADVAILFDEVHAFNPDKSKLTAETLAQFIAQLPIGGPDLPGR